MESYDKRDREFKTGQKMKKGTNTEKSEKNQKKFNRGQKMKKELKRDKMW